MEVKKIEMGLAGDGITLSEDDFEIDGVAPPDYADAVNSHKKVKKELDKRFKDQYKSANEFINQNHKQDLKPKGTKEMKKLKLSEALFNEAVATLDPPLSDIYYKKKREPLSVIIQDELTKGEVVYRRNAKGGFNPTWAPSLNIQEDDIGANTDSYGDYIIAHVATEDECEQVEAIARKYGREYKSGFDKYVVGNKYYTKIYLEDSDWDDPYYDPDSQIINNKKFA